VKVGAIILAAGKASRFGQPKQILEIGGQTLVERAVGLVDVVGCEPVIVVTGAYHDQIQSESYPDQVRLLHHPNWQDGMGSSLALGSEAMAHSGVDAVLILLADQPAISEMTLQKIFEQMQPPEITIVISDTGEVTGPPALFHRIHFEELSQLSGDCGAKKIAMKYTEETMFIKAPEAQWDIDDPYVWANFQEEFGLL